MTPFSIEDRNGTRTSSVIDIEHVVAAILRGKDIQVLFDINATFSIDVNSEDDASRVVASIRFMMEEYADNQKGKKNATPAESD